MTGHAMNRGRYHYYRCLKTFRGKYKDSCRSRYINVEAIERAVREALADECGRPERIMEEARRLAAGGSQAARLDEISRELREIEAQQSRLADLYVGGTLPQSVLTEKAAALQRKRTALEAERRAIESASGPRINTDRLAADLPVALAKVREFLLTASADDFDLALRALQVSMSADRDHVEISGVVPALTAIDDPTELYATIERTSA